MTNIFPFESVRPGQDVLVKKVEDALASKKNLLAHAPTGIGKTAAVLAPAVSFAIENKKRVVFVTPRHSQHRIAIETLQKMLEKSGDKKFNASDIIGRQWLCNYEFLDKMQGTDFASWCAHHIKNGSCTYRKSTFQKEGMLSEDAKDTLEKLDGHIMHVEDAKDLCKGLCPHEILMRHAEKSEVIIADYFHVFHPKIAPVFFARTGISPSDCILIVDEAHNAASRIRSMCSAQLTSRAIELARSELESAGLLELAKDVGVLSASLEKTYNEKTVFGTKEAFSEKSDIAMAVEKIAEYEVFTGDLEAASDDILKLKKKSFAGALATFLSAWAGSDEGFARVVSAKRTAFGKQFSFSYHCIDPSLVASGILNGMHSSILMSGTLFPAEMHKSMLGLANVDTLELGSPFPKENRLNLVSTTLTSKYSERSEATYKTYAKYISEIINYVPGNVGVYFPSYDFRDKVSESLKEITVKPLIFEEAGATKNEKQNIFDKFASNAKKGSALLAVVGAGFSEGVDFPGELMNASVIAGMPLERPDLLTKATIEYYDKKFGRGWDFGYTYPAINRAVQAGGRCIRSETDRGIVFFLDMRFLWPNYRSAMPKDIRLKPMMNLKKEITDFFRASPI